MKMGYCVTYDINVTFDTKDEAAMVAAINALHEAPVRDRDAGGGSWSGGVKTASWYRFTDNPPEGGFTTLEEALKAWRFSMWNDDFSFDGDKTGQEEILFGALAPFLTGEIHGRGEDDAEWGYRFRDGVMVGLTCEKTWTED